MRLRESLTITALIAVMAPGTALGAEKYVFDPNHTEIRYSWEHFGFSTTSAYFRDFDGTLMFDQDDITASRVEVTIDTTSISTGRDDFTEHLLSEDFFHVDEYPEARFVSTAIHPAGDDRYTVEGELTIRGITRDVELDVTINRIGESPATGAHTIGFNAETQVRRSEFDLGMYTPAVGDEVTIRISSEMPREADLD